MSSSTLRRLAKDHRSLHADLPPNFLFQASNESDSVPDDLTRLTILLAGPQGTPYSRGVWKLQIKIPDDYPRSPPKAAFRTRIWHPNVEESSGSVCVETLKRDWDPKLTLRDVLITISCLLIQPNPDSALNSAAGQLLQEDYEAYARQAKLMTSIHAMVPAELREAVVEAKKRGEDAGTELREDQEQESKTIRHASASSVVMKTRPILTPRTLALSDTSPSFESARPTPPHLTLEPTTTTIASPTTNPSDPDSDSDSDSDSSAHKENDPSLSPSPVPCPPPRKSLLGKRPLSDLPPPLDPDPETASPTPPDPSSSTQNIANNHHPTPQNNNTNNPPPSSTTTSFPPRRSPKLVERSRSLNAHPSSSSSSSSTTAAPLTAPFAHSIPDDDDDDDDDDGGPAPKRVCSGEGKENFPADKAAKVAVAPKLAVGAGVPKVGGVARQVSVGAVGGVPGGKGGRMRVGVRRL